MGGKQNSERQSNAPFIEHIDALYGYALFLTHNRADAEDLVQETYVRATNAIGNLRENSNMKGWLFTILRNLWLNQVRSRRRFPQMSEIDDLEGANCLVEPSKNCEDLYMSKIQAEQVRAAIQSLPSPFQEVILLREFEEMSYLEIAAILGCPVGTVMSRLSRARKILRILLSPTPKTSRIPKLQSAMMSI